MFYQTCSRNWFKDVLFRVVLYKHILNGVEVWLFCRYVTNPQNAYFFFSIYRPTTSFMGAITKQPLIQIRINIGFIGFYSNCHGMKLT
jgi:hypothetical protein